MQSYIKKLESILEKTNDEIEKLKFETIKSETDEEKAKKIDIISKYYQTIISSSMLFSKEIEEKVKCFYNYNSINDNSVVYYNPRKNKVIERDDEVTPSFRVKTGKVFESEDEVECSRIVEGNQDFDQIVINVPKNYTIKRNGSVIICDDETEPSFKIRGKVIKQDDEVTPSFRVKTGKVIEREDESNLSFAVKMQNVIEREDEVTPSFSVKTGKVVERADEVAPSFRIKTGKVFESEDEITPVFKINEDLFKD